MDAAILTMAAAELPLDEVGKLSATLERGGLYSAVALLLLVVGYLYVSKERLQRDILAMVREQTVVLTKQQLVAEKVEALLGRVSARLDIRQACPFQKSPPAGGDQP